MAKRMTPITRIRYGASVGALTGAIWGLVDTVGAVYFGGSIPWQFPVLAIASYVLLAALGGAAAGVVAGWRLRGAAPHHADATRARTRGLCLAGACLATLAICLIREVSLEATLAAVAVLTAGAAASALLFGIRLVSERAYAWQVLCAAGLLVYWMQVDAALDESAASTGQRTAGYAAFFVGVALAYAAGWWLLGRMRWLVRVDTPRQSAVRAAAAALLGVGLSLGLIAARETPYIHRPHRMNAAQAGTRRPNVILISLDTVRADHLSLYGYHRPTSPNLTSLAAEGVVYERAISPASWTLPAHASLFTGVMPSQHGAHYYNAYDLAESAEEMARIRLRTQHTIVRPLPEDFETLAERLWSSGYATAAIVSNSGALNHVYQLAQGFDLYDDRSDTSLRSVRSRLDTPAIAVWRKLYELLGGVTTEEFRTAAEMNREIVRWLDSEPPKPFFLFINYMDAHDPYTRRVGYALGELGGQSAAGSTGLSRVPPAYRENVDIYDSELAYLDDHLGRLLATLKARGLYEDSMIVVFSDHGEAFGEHGWFTHGRSLHQEEVWVPLVIRYPNARQRGAVAATTSTLVVFDEILRVAGARDRRSAPTPSGVDERVRSPGGPPKVLAELWPQWDKDDGAHPGGVTCAVVSEDGVKVIRNPDEQVEVYDLATDPVEVDNLYGRSLDFVAWAEPWLMDWAAMMRLRRPAEDTSVALENEMLEQLRTLGYVGE